MFEAVELGHKVSKAQFEEQETGLRTELLAAQRRLRETPIAVLVMVAGVVGVKKFAFDLWGNTVNTASRMESHGEPGRVNISAETYARIVENPRFRCKQREPIDVKGKGEMQMYFVEPGTW